MHVHAQYKDMSSCIHLVSSYCVYDVVLSCVHSHLHPRQQRTVVQSNLYKTGIHLKTGLWGGKVSHAYPDDDYYHRSLDELDKNGVRLADIPIGADIAMGGGAKRRRLSVD